MFSGFGLMNTVFQMCEQMGKLPDEIVSMDTATWCSQMIWNSARTMYQNNLQKIKSENK